MMNFNLYSTYNILGNIFMFNGNYVLVKLFYKKSIEKG